eukprot:TRINITY_DN250_c0_g2_i1.p2 TRINITY_DN250_c0_g2~~TRINITY_DN250_c0_g2_i1.p2  ORF type:complete len:130 (-),score=15.62 TRINITY_DN250_c0_g2_i1:19-408(-)
MKDVGVAYVLWFFFGLFGVHRFYLDRPCSGLVWLCTGGFFLIGWIVDICLIPGMVDDYNCHAESVVHHHYHHHHDSPSSSLPPLSHSSASYNTPYTNPYQHTPPPYDPYVTPVQTTVRPPPMNPYYSNV